MSVETDATLAVSIHRAVIGSAHAAVFRTLRRWYESVNAFAAWPTVDDLAERVQTACILAWIYAAMFVTDRVQRAVLGPGAVAFRLTASRVRIAYVTRRALAYRIACGTSYAERGWMTGVRTARFHGDTLDIGYRVCPVPRWALADGFMIIRDTDCVYAARVFVTGVIAGVRESVTELRRWTIDIVDTGYRSASGRWVVRIARVESGRALAVGHVIVDDAKRIRAASDEIADQLAGERTVRGAATRLVFQALAVGGTAVFARTVTSSTVVRIADVTRQAVAAAVVILCHAA